MTFRQTILPEAHADFDEAVRWYAKEKKGRARSFVAAVKRVWMRLRRMPKAHAIVMKDVRRPLVPGFPYIVLYRVTDDEVLIISIFHTSQDRTNGNLESDRSRSASCCNRKMNYGRIGARSLRGRRGFVFSAR